MDYYFFDISNKTGFIYKHKQRFYLFKGQQYNTSQLNV